jgi:hypothetical protein
VSIARFLLTAVFSFPASVTWIPRLLDSSPPTEMAMNGHKSNGHKRKSQGGKRPATSAPATTRPLREEKPDKSGKGLKSDYQLEIPQIQEADDDCWDDTQDEACTVCYLLL